MRRDPVCVPPVRAPVPASSPLPACLPPVRTRPHAPLQHAKRPAAKSAAGRASCRVVIALRPRGPKGAESTERGGERTSAIGRGSRQPYTIWWSGQWSRMWRDSSRAERLPLVLDEGGEEGRVALLERALDAARGAPLLGLGRHVQHAVNAHHLVARRVGLFEKLHRLDARVEAASGDRNTATQRAARGANNGSRAALEAQRIVPGQDAALRSKTLPAGC
mmetsp:Transcript_16287/g.44292  ORF Transcript_16287/g.44292 Transcript_16287/m.44292 type:complete len:220 (+) Transcript_16287:121-780(+)